VALALTLALPASAARADVSLDPAIANQGTALVIEVDALAQDGQPASALSFTLPRGMRVDTSAAPKAAQTIGFGRFVEDVSGFLAPGGTSQLSWSIAAYLGKPVKRNDVASVRLVSSLLGANDVAALLSPALGVSVPQTVTTTARLRRGSSGIELLMSELPVTFAVAPPAMVSPSRLELSLSAVRRVRENFVRRYKVRTPSGYEIRRIRDHRLISHDLFRAPRRCGTSWSSSLRVTYAGGATRRSTATFPCQKTQL
jgi:hypothetical protein